MGNEKTKVNYELETTLDECISKLKGLVEGLEQRQLVLRNRSEAVELPPAAIISLSVQAKQKGHRESLEIELEWKTAHDFLVEAARQSQAASVCPVQRTGGRGGERSEH
jgi:amphi-Trp domain-containing protein